MIWATVCSNKITEKVATSPSKDQSNLVKCSQRFSDRYRRVERGNEVGNRERHRARRLSKVKLEGLKAQFPDIKICPGPSWCFFRRFLRSITVIFISPGTCLCKTLCQINERRQTTCSACRAQVPSMRLLR